MPSDDEFPDWESLLRLSLGGAIVEPFSAEPACLGGVYLVFRALMIPPVDGIWI